MKLLATGFIIPKEEYAENECEDAFLYDNIKNLRFAIADGATNSSYSDKWASILVTYYVNSSSSDFIERIRELQQEWHGRIDWDSLPWYEMEKAKRGDHSTLLGISFCPYGNTGIGNWKAIAIGDSCLFQIRNDILITRFPLKESKQFTDYPPLVSSTAKNYTELRSNIKIVNGDFEVDDLFLLMTDAAAQWFLESYEKEWKPWVEIEKLETDEDFRKFIFLMRKTKNMKDDDVTILRIKLSNVELMVI